MITLATIAVGFDVEVDRAKRDQIANSAFDLADQAAREFLPLTDFGVDATVERGSVDVFVAVLVSVPTLLTALASYGSASEGLDRLKADIKSMKKYFVKELPHRADLPHDAFEASRLTMEELSKIGGFIKDVERGQLPPQEGARRACAELERVDESLDKETKRDLEKSFKAIQAKPEEHRLPSSAEREYYDGAGAPITPRRRIPRKPSRRDRIRIWRNPGESKRHREEPE